MRNDLTDITIVLDRSGSMQSRIADAEGGINTLITEQKEQPGEANFTLVEFDDRYEVTRLAIPIRYVKPVRLVPRGSTALLDAVGKAITQTGQRLAALPETLRPGLVVFVVVTDGEENASREYTKTQIKALVEHQQAKYQWKFVFLGANQDSFHEAGQLGFHMGAIANYNMQNTSATYLAASSNLSAARSASFSGVVASDISMDWSDAQRDSLVDDEAEKSKASA